ncbi:MAG: hypothetical protein QM755_21705 [Luteolibacter sp.]
MSSLSLRVTMACLMAVMLSNCSCAIYTFSYAPPQGRSIPPAAVGVAASANGFVAAPPQDGLQRFDHAGMLDDLTLWFDPRGGTLRFHDAKCFPVGVERWMARNDGIRAAVLNALKAQGVPLVEKRLGRKSEGVEASIPHSPSTQVDQGNHIEQ